MATETLKITKADLDANNCYTVSVSVNFQGSVEIGAGLGIVLFKGKVKAGAEISALAGSGISAGLGISAGEGISAGLGISAGWGISAGEGISAGWGISAGFSVKCKASLRARLRIFAGVCMWRLPGEEENLIECKRLEGGALVSSGRLIETSAEMAYAHGKTAPTA